MLLITASTPQARADEHKARLAKMFSCQARDIVVKLVDATCEVPSTMVAEHSTWLYADSEVSSMAPTSIKLARDIAVNWLIMSYDVAGRTSPLHRCTIKPQQQRKRNR